MVEAVWDKPDWPEDPTLGGGCTGTAGVVSVLARARCLPNSGPTRCHQQSVRPSSQETASQRSARAAPARVRRWACKPSSLRPVKSRPTYAARLLRGWLSSTRSQAYIRASRRPKGEGAALRRGWRGVSPASSATIALKLTCSLGVGARPWPNGCTGLLAVISLPGRRSAWSYAVQASVAESDRRYRRDPRGGRLGVARA
jgi:hypothetical protein